MKIILTFTLLMIPGVVSSMRVTGYSGGGVMITCGYDEGYRGNAKYFCKGQWSTCTDQIKTEEKNKWVQQDRFSLYDDTTSRIFTVTIRDLSERDSGTYYCGTERFGSDPYTEVDLEVITDDCFVKNISRSAAAGGSVNISCKYPQSHRSDVKFLCWRSGDDLCAEESSVTKKSKWIRKGKIQLYDDREEQLLTGSISHVTEQHSEYWCGVQSDRGHKSFITRVLIRVTGVSRTSTSLPSLNTSSGSSLIIVLVLVLLVLIIAGLSLLFLCKKHQSRGGDSPSQTGPREHEVVSYTGCDYEEIKDTHKQLPTNPSSNCVYATVQKATGDSQCCITSAEDLNYAVVNFHKESDCPDSVSIRNNQDYSEYAAVSHLTA
ncbi:uncharacterized protein LOC127502223 isoform X39 [Ctenopharyngodon idella]|uniref:uncharacterized protein LOC127502223 isoform X38 n=1 Tax=Ctenopharyngodon idella TaxID=7959 RepID=UPI00223212DB|nr:uncharacterized protein LOC127502223 isoform X38 [Ctenopharyngodon idella]XP_051730958.1 uncharacterized protein LOC127502223 isoform X39 [Ctenopharyngodon idella]